MRKQLLALTLGLMTFGLTAQKKELKAVEKALKKNDFTNAVASITAAEALMSNMDVKSKAKFFFLKGKTYAGKKDFKKAATAFNSLISLEKKSGKAKYTKEAGPMLNDLKNSVQQKAFDLYKAKKLNEAAETFYLRYTLDEKDTLFLSNAAQLYLQDKNYDKAGEYYSKLRDIGYTGIETEYLATNKETGEVKNFNSDKAQRDLMVKGRQYTKPTEQKTKSKKVDIIKNVAMILKEQGKTEEAIAAFSQARASDPDDLQLILAEAFMYNDLKQMDKFEKLMKEAVEKDPTNPDLFFNIGIVNYNEKRKNDAINYFKKTLELKDDYKEANWMLANSMLLEDQEIVDKMNALPPSDMSGYTKLENRRKELYTSILDPLTKADSQNRTIDTVRLLMNVYDTVENEAKAAEYRALYKTMK